MTTTVLAASPEPTPGPSWLPVSPTLGAVASPEAVARVRALANTSVADLAERFAAPLTVAASIRDSLTYLIETYDAERAKATV